MSKAKQSQTRRNRRGVESIAIEHNERGGVMLHVLPNVNRSYLTPWLVTLGAYGDYRVLCWARDYQGAVDTALEVSLRAAGVREVDANHRASRSGI